MCRTTAIIKCQQPKIIAEFSKDFGNYYFSLIPKYYYANRQKYNTHVTIVRGFEKPKIWKDFLDINGTTIDIFYSPIILYIEPYFFMNCWSKQIINIRRELGLSKYRFNKQQSYHISIGNTK